MYVAQFLKFKLYNMQTLPLFHFKTIILCCLFYQILNLQAQKDVKNLISFAGPQSDYLKSSSVLMLQKEVKKLYRDKDKVEFNIGTLNKTVLTLDTLSITIENKDYQFVRRGTRKGAMGDLWHRPRIRSCGRRCRFCDVTMWRRPRHGYCRRKMR